MQYAVDPIDIYRKRHAYCTNDSNQIFRWMYMAGAICAPLSDCAGQSWNGFQVVPVPRLRMTAINIEVGGILTRSRANDISATH